MARETGDLWPQASGTAALGAEMVNNGVNGNVRPFAHIHVNSGVFHNPINATSGIIRFKHVPLDPNDPFFSPPINSEFDSFDFSFDGGGKYDLFIGSHDISDIRSPDGRVFIKTGNNKHLTVISSGVLMTLENSLLIRTGMDFEVIAPDSSIVATVDLNLQNTDGPARLNSTGGDTLISSDAGLDGDGGEVRLSVFGGSGLYNYRFGPHQSWYIKTSHSNTGGPFNDGFWPIAHSGNVAQMIAQGGGSPPTLQTAYQNGRSIITRSNEGGAVRVSGLTAVALRLEANEGGFAHIALSGLLRAPTTFTEQGELVLMRHGLNLDSPLMSSVADQGYIAAKSLGLPTLWLHCGGSGIAPVRIASGIAQFFNVFDSAAITETGLNAPFIEVGQTNPDRHFRAITSSGIQVLVPGLYKVQYSATIKKTVGELEQQINVQVRVNDRWGNTFKIFGGDSYATVRDTLNINNTANGQCVLDLNTGEVVNVFGLANSIPIAPNVTIFQNRAVNMILEYLGPQRGISSVRVKV